MKTYVKAELMKLRRNKIVTLVPVIIGVVILWIAHSLKNQININLIYKNIDVIAVAGCALSMIVIFVLSEDLSFGTLKNLNTVNLKIDKVLRWKVAVQLIKELELFIFYIFIFSYAANILQNGTEDIQQLHISLIKIFVSLPTFIGSVLLLDMIFIKAQSIIVAMLVYYYGFIQILFLLMFSGHFVENVITRMLLMPVQLGYFYSHELNMKNVGLTIISQMMYLALLWWGYVKMTSLYSSRVMKGDI